MQRSGDLTFNFRNIRFQCSRFVFRETTPFLNACRSILSIFNSNCFILLLYDFIKVTSLDILMGTLLTSNKSINKRQYYQHNDVLITLCLQSTHYVNKITVKILYRLLTENV